MTFALSLRPLGYETTLLWEWTFWNANDVFWGEKPEPGVRAQDLPKNKKRAPLDPLPDTGEEERIREEWRRKGYDPSTGGSSGDGVFPAERPASGVKPAPPEDEELARPKLRRMRARIGKRNLFLISV